jgi:uncharacterized protein (TIGR00251 family)
MTDIDIRETAGGVVIAVNVRPKAKREGISGIHDGALKVGVNAPPEKGKANASVAALLAETFGVAKENIVLQSGATSRKKRFLITGINRSDVIKALKAAGLIE